MTGMTRVLIVEDSPTQAEVLRVVLDQAGFSVKVAHDGEAALAAFEGETFDIVVSDIVMPGMSGYELCQKIKSMPRGKATPVMLLSSLSDPMDIIRGLECEADNFITKPYEPRRLIARIRSILENRKARVASGIKFGVELVFLGKTFLINSEKEQILDLLIATFEDTVRTNLGLQKSQTELAAAKAKVEEYARELEDRVRERTLELEKKAEQLNAALETSHKSEARFRGLVSNLALPMLVFHRETLAFLHVNDAAMRGYGYDTREFLQLTIEDLRAPEEKVSLQSQFDTLFDHKRGLRLRHRKKNGEIIDVEVTGAALDFQDSPAILAVVSDVTERLKIEAQVRHSERLDAIGGLTGGVAHDFNNLLAVIRANAEDLFDELSDSSLRPSAEMILEASDRGAELVRHLMAFARKQELSPTPIDLDALVGSVIKLARRTLPTNITIRQESVGQLPQVNIDPGRLENALINLAVNARDAMPDGGELVIELGVAELDEQYAREHAEVQPGFYVLMAVSDTGTGMPQEVIDRAFEPFFTTKEVGKGTGLGLSMVYGLVKQSGGHMKIYSVLGKGTTFKIYLPALSKNVTSPVEKAKEKTLSSTIAVDKGTRKILLVEDDDLVRKSVTAKLTRLGFDVSVVGSAAEAIATLETTSDFNLMLSDVMMPGTMNGADLAREVLRRWPTISVLLSSGYTESTIGGKVKLPEGVRLLSKPYSNADLARALEEALKK